MKNPRRPAGKQSGPTTRNLPSRGGNEIGSAPGEPAAGEAFYRVNAEQYFAATSRIDPAPFLQPLADRLAPGSRIIDIGCGSGRDLRWFREHGFTAVGFEGSPQLARRARQHSGCPVIEGDFTDYDFSSLNFDAVTLIGALVHLEHDRLAPTLVRIAAALKTTGLLYLTLKEGAGFQSAPDGRIFTLWPEARLRRIFNSMNFAILDFSRQASKLNPGDTWLGFILKP